MKLVLETICDKVQGGFYRLKIIYIEQLPIKQINPNNKKEMKAKEEIIGLVNQLLKLNTTIAECSNNQQHEILQRQIFSIDSQLDHLVSVIYGF
jgi:hypothetical protein